ncbi:MAG: geranylgeranyl pyrophosphate synthase [Cognaticolwellia sp.]|jgi:geranylgeranyl pyrophosphate synthase
MSLARNTLAPTQQVDALMLALAGTGPLGDMIRTHLQTGGRRTRAQLALLAAHALDVDDPIAWAAACELLHNATLVHDDLQDGDRVRRGHPTLWATYGVAQAINSGDLMLMLPFMALGRQSCTPEQHVALSQALANRAVLCVKGQALDLDLTKRTTWSMDDWHEAAIGKSGQLLALPIEGAAVLAGREDSAELGDHFAEAGALYQMVDDMVDLYGEKGRGERGCDLREGKISALVVRHLELAPQDGAWLRGVLRAERDQTQTADIKKAARRFRESGAVDALLADIQLRTEELCSADLPEGLRKVASALAQRCTRDLGDIA